MSDIMKGIRVLEVAEHTFVPAASAVLAEWGADVVKVEHVTRGDYQLVDGVRVPMSFEIARAAGGERFPFWFGRITSIRFESQ